MARFSLLTLGPPEHVMKGRWPRSLIAILYSVFRANQAGFLSASEGHLLFLNSVESIDLNLSDGSSLTEVLHLWLEARV